jgi:hypothetical protein
MRSQEAARQPSPQRSSGAMGGYRLWQPRQVHDPEARLLSMTTGKDTRAKPTAPKPFTLCAAGQYDNELLEKLPFERWEPLCLELFGCRAEPHGIGGVPMSGKRKNDPVHTFPFHETEAEMASPISRRSRHDSAARSGGSFTSSLRRRATPASSKTSSPTTARATSSFESPIPPSPPRPQLPAARSAGGGKPGQRRP